MARERSMSQSLGTLSKQLKQLRVLMVGAGGIGCELLKNLVLSGFGEIHIVDLDTIDLSNLNRQFLFRHEHIKKSKAVVAKETASKFNPNVKLEAHHANIKDSQFNVAWFKTFNIVFNALDNLDARRHVNKMCLMADVPLIESGTTGFDGQVQVIRKGKSECYDCQPKPVQKSFPICTIRSTPSQPIHCIVWAKSYLLPEMFGVSEEADMDISENDDNAEEIKKLKEEALALKKIRESIFEDSFPKLIFEKVFKQDIDRLRSIEDMWKSRKPPEPLNYDQMAQVSSGIDTSMSKQDQTPWSLAQNHAVFVDSIRRLVSRYKMMQGVSMTPIINFDKDDEDTLDFVAAAANLRSSIFGIEAKSKFDIKQMAGNIIPAIATTNAMTAGLCVLQAFKVLKGEYHKAKMVFLERSTARIINAEPLHSPNPDCVVCGNASSDVLIDPTRATLGHLVEDVLKQELGYSDDISVLHESTIIYDPDVEDNLPKKFADLGLKSDSVITIVDDAEEDPRVNLSLSINEQTLPEDRKPVILPDKVEIPRKPKHTNGVNGSNSSNGSDEQHGEKRKRSPSITTEPHSKKQASGKTEDALVVDDSAGGAIVLD